MDALVMCGGRGTRLDADVEKPLLEIDGVPLIDRVLAAIRGSRIDGIHAAVSPATPATRRHVRRRDVSVIETPGDGYVADLRAATADVGRPILTVAADLPLLTPAVVDAVLERYDGRAAIQVCVPAALKRALGASADTTYERDGREVAPAGINVVTASDAETVVVWDERRLAVNVNRPGDAAVAEALA